MGCARLSDWLYTNPSGEVRALSGLILLVRPIRSPLIRGYFGRPGETLMGAPENLAPQPQVSRDPAFTAIKPEGLMAARHGATFVKGSSRVNCRM